MTASQYRRLKEKLLRLAYELEHDAARLRAACPAYATRANGLAAIASDLDHYVRRVNAED